MCPALDSFGVAGLLEPLGFPQSSLRSITTAARAIDEVGSEVFMVVLDTFHFALGTDSYEDLPIDDKLDDHRVLVTGNDRLQTCRQASALVTQGYAGPRSFKPFSSALHDMPQQELIESVRASTDYVRSQMGTR